MKLQNLITLSAFVLAGALSAAETTPAPDPKSSAVSPNEMDRIGSLAQISGKVTTVKTVSMVGIADPHLMVKITSEDGDMDIVDLGSAAELKANGLDPKEGQQLWVYGRVGRINEKPLVFAESVSDTKLIAINRTTPLREESVKHAEARKDGKDAKVAADGKDGKGVECCMFVRTLEGTVMQTSRLKVEGEAEEHMLAKLQTDDGVAAIDLGAASALPKVNLGEGQMVAVTGFVGRLNDKPIIIADTVGNLSSIQRANSASTDKAK